MPPEDGGVAKDGRTVAVIGAGIAGETAAYLLHRYSPLTVEALFESSDVAGLHANSITLENGIHVDVPLRAVSPHYYPNLTALYRHLGIALNPVDYSSVGLFFDTGRPFFRHNNVIILGRAIPFLLWEDIKRFEALRGAFNILRDVLWFVFTGPFFLAYRDLLLRDKSLGEFFREQNYSYEFIHLFFYPAMSTLLSCSYTQVDEYPADYILEFYCARATTIFTGWFRVGAGVVSVSEKLLADIPRARQHYSNAVRSVRQVPLAEAKSRGFTLKRPAGASMVEVIDAHGKVRFFDKVIIATEPSAAAKIWTDKTPEEAEMLASIDTFAAGITVHRDARLMPPNRRDWKGLNYFCRERDEAERALGEMLNSLEKVTEKPLTDASPASSSSPKKRSTTPRRAGSVCEEKDMAVKTPSVDIRAAMTTAFLNLYHPDLPRPGGGVAATETDLFETWNSFVPPRNVISHAWMVRSVWHHARRSVFRRHFSTHQGERGIYLAGSYAAEGITLLEQAVTSSCLVAQRLGATVPFKVRPSYESRWWSLALAHALVLLLILFKLLRTVFFYAFLPCLAIYYMGGMEFLASRAIGLLDALKMLKA